MAYFPFPYLTTAFGALLAFFLGMIWYHPKILGTHWMKARGSEASGGSVRDVLPFFISLALWLIASCFYSFLVGLLHIDEANGYISLACLLWVAFAMPPIIMGSLYTGYPFQAVAIDAGYHLAGYYMFALSHIALGSI